VSVMVDVQAVSMVIVCVSVVAGFIYYSLQIRQQTEARQTGLVAWVVHCFWQQGNERNVGRRLKSLLSQVCVCSRRFAWVFCRNIL